MEPKFNFDFDKSKFYSLSIVLLVAMQLVRTTIPIFYFIFFLTNKNIEIFLKT
jgi:hypothetical protein